MATSIEKVVYAYVESNLESMVTSLVSEAITSGASDLESVETYVTSKESSLATSEYNRLPTLIKDIFKPFKASIIGYLEAKTDSLITSVYNISVKDTPIIAPPSSETETTG